MKTQITVETTDAQRFVIGAYVTGEPHKASREEVVKFFERPIATELEIVDGVAKQQRAFILKGLGLPDQEPLADDES